MMNFRRILSSSLLAFSCVAFADNAPGSNQNDDLSTLLTNLGLNFGYDITSNKCAADSKNCIPPTGGSALLNEQQTATLWANLLNSYLGSAFMGSPVVPTDNSTKNSQVNVSAVNQSAGTVFSNYSSDSSQTASIFSLIDQPPYQSNPVSQAVLNILATSDPTYCSYYTNMSSIQNSSTPGAQLQSSCPLLFNAKVASAAVSNFPKAKEAFTGEYNQQLLPALSANSFLDPLQYGTTKVSNADSNSKTITLVPVSTQLEQAQGFVRYLTSQFSPVSLPHKSDYDQLFSQAGNLTGDVSAEDQVTAIGTLLNYFVKLRMYTAQTSVAISNIYQIFASRLAQNNNTSEALNEYTMATWRLSDQPANGQTKPWAEQINEASVSTVQKEIAMLLSEINYQLYLTRKQNERLLLTQSILLLQGSQMIKPDANIGSSSSPGSGFGQSN